MRESIGSDVRWVSRQQRTRLSFVAAFYFYFIFFILCVFGDNNPPGSVVVVVVSSSLSRWQHSWSGSEIHTERNDDFAVGPVVLDKLLPLLPCTDGHHYSGNMVYGESLVFIFSPLKYPLRTLKWVNFDHTCGMTGDKYQMGLSRAVSLFS